MVKAILFDLDGTLLDTVPDIRATLNEALRGHGYPEIDYAHTCAYVGDGARQLIERALPAGTGRDDADAVYKDFRTRFAKSENELTRLYPAEREVLAALKARGLKMGVVTNKPQDAAENVIGKFFPADFFDFVGGDSGMFPCKPDPSLARYAALSLRLAPAECVFAGDGETDAKTALSAGMVGVSVLWGYRTRAQLAAAGAVRFAENFMDFQKILEKLC